MRAIDLLEFIRKQVIAYRLRAVESVNSNRHMNALKGECKLTQDEVDALLTDFVNFVGIGQGIDYALYASDLKGVVKSA